MTSGLESWDEGYRNHSAWNLMEQVVETLQDVDADNEADQEKVDRIWMTLRHLLGRRDSPSLLVSSTMLENINTTSSNLKSQVDAWASNRNPAHLDQAMIYLGHVLENARGWPGGPEQSLRSAAAAVREAVKASNRHVANAEQAIDKAIASFEDRQSNIEADFDQRDAGMIERFEALEEDITTAQKDLKETQTRLDKLVDQHQERFDRAEESRIESHQEMLTNHRAELDEVLAKARELTEQTAQVQREAGQQLLEELEALRKKAADVVSVVATSTTSDWYKRHADDQKTTANRMRGIAVGLFIAAFAVTGVWVFTLDSEDDSWRMTIVKTALSVSILAAAGYLISESTKHRNEEFETRQTELTLRALDPFIAPVEAQKREEVLIAAARALFVTKKAGAPAEMQVERPEKV